MPGVTRVLVIDDDRMICQLLAEYLRPHGYEVSTAHTGHEGAALAISSQPDVVILDVMLPGLDGFGVLRRIRAQSGVPVLMLTSRGEERERIAGLDSGADEYVPKTFSHRELLARLNAVVRRARATNPGDVVEGGGFRLDSARRMVRYGETRLELTTAEFEILEALMRAGGRVLSREQLLQVASERVLEVSDRSIDVHISSLRRKMGDEKAARCVETVRSLGYRFRDAEEK